ncbi:MAG: outer membrane beta-barrel protein [Bacteroidales bacterium]|nr:outer membrane beta-barrel protein [Bacteroidales bacterium]
MRKILLIFVAVLLVSLPALSQFNSGSFYFSGATHGKLAFESQSSEFGSNYNTLCIGLTPEAGYFIRNRLAVGGAILMDIEKGLGEFGSSIYEVVFGPNVRYYLPRDTDMQVFLYGFAGYGFVTDHQLLKIIAGPGINFFLTEKIAFEAKVLYALSREWNPEMGGNHNLHDVMFLAGISMFFSDLTFISRKGELVE